MQELEISYKDGNPSEGLLKLQSVQLEILKKFKAFCEEHDLCYFLTAGTALGAVRHRGFIPWDDDVDIGMPRNHYDRFITLFQERPIKGLFLQNQHTENEFPLSFSKLRKNGTHYEEESMVDLNINKGIFIDIFPYDSVHKNSFILRCQKYLLILINVILWSATKSICKQSRSTVGKLTRYFFYYLRPILPIKKLFLLQGATMKFANASNSNFLCCFDLYGPKRFNKTIVNKDKIIPLVGIEFHGEIYPLPNDYDGFLSSLYGNYLKLPANEEMKPSHIVSAYFRNENNQL